MPTYLVGRDYVKIAVSSVGPVVSVPTYEYGRGFEPRQVHFFV